MNTIQITLTVTPDNRDLLLSALADQALDHDRQANRQGASQLARRGHQSMRDDLVSIHDQISAQVKTDDQPALQAV